MDNEFMCSVCRNKDVPNTKRWVMHDKDICVACMFKKTIKNIDGSEINWTDDLRIADNASI